MALNDTILLISDQHMPFHHCDMFDFLNALKKKYKPTRIINLGDEADKHRLSFHNSIEELFSAGEELEKTIEYIQEMYKMFPKMDILESNHGSLHLRRARHHGLPFGYLKTYNDLYGVDHKWKWHKDLTIKLPNGLKCYFHHGKVKDSAKLGQSMGMCAVQGHYHESFKVDYWGNPDGLYWGMNIGCLIDNDQLSFEYNRLFPKRPIIGTGIIEDSLPRLLPMVLNKKGRWNKKVP